MNDKDQIRYVEKLINDGYDMSARLRNSGIPGFVERAKELEGFIHDIEVECDRMKRDQGKL